MDKEQFEGETISSNSTNNNNNNINNTDDKNLIDLNFKIEQQKDADPCAVGDGGTKIKFNFLKNPAVHNNKIIDNNIKSNKTSLINEIVIVPQRHASQKHANIPYILNGELYQIQTQKGENVTVKCCNCPPDRVYRGSVRSTGNFHMHIKRRHPHLMSKLHEMKVHALLERRDRLIKRRCIKSPPQSIIHPRLAPISLQTSNYLKHIKDANDNDVDSDNNQDTIDINKVQKQETNFVPKNTIAAQMENEEETIIKLPPPKAHELSNTAYPSSNAGTLADCSNNWQFAASSSIAVTNKFSESDNKLFYKIKPEVPSTSATLAPIDLSKSNNNIAYSPIPPIKRDNRPAYRSEDHSHLFCQISNEMSTTNTKELLVHLSDTLQSIQRAMSVRNQLESNRILFDVSKFKYLHPDFVFEF